MASIQQVHSHQPTDLGSQIPNTYNAPKAKTWVHETPFIDSSFTSQGAFINTLVLVVITWPVFNFPCRSRRSDLTTKKRQEMFAEETTKAPGNWSA